MNNQPNNWQDNMKDTGNQITERAKELVETGNARTFVIRKPNGEILTETSLTIAVAVGLVATMLMPFWFVVAVIAALVMKVRFEVVPNNTEGSTTIITQERISVE